MPDCKNLATLDEALLAAHEANDHGALIKLYWEAGQLKEGAGNVDAACFYFTHAYVFALEAGDPMSAKILGKLVEHGRDAFPSN